MLTQLLVFVIKILIGTTLGLLGVYATKNRRKIKMRIFDDLTPEQQQGVFFACISYAKGEIDEFNLPPSTDVLALALEYDTMYFLELIDFAGQNPELIPAFVGSRPVKRP